MLVIIWVVLGRLWFKMGREEGLVVVFYLGSRIYFFYMLEWFRGEDWEYEWDNVRGNRFGYLGNGFLMWEVGDEKGDLVWYLDELVMIL